MRLWTLHPKYLDPRGLVALWREALFAQAVLRGWTVREFNDRDARAQGVLPRPVEGVSRLPREHLGHHGVGQPEGLRRVGGPPRNPAIDGSVVPAAAAGSLMFTPEITVPALREMQRRFGDRNYGRYGFADAFHPASGWVNPDLIGIDLGITLLNAENLRSGRVWTWFMKNPEITDALDRSGLRKD